MKNPCQKKNTHLNCKNELFLDPCLGNRAGTDMLTENGGIIIYNII